MTHYQSYSDSADLTVTYVYDVFNHWIGETVTSGGTTTQTRFVYDGNQIVMQFDKTGTGALAATDFSHRYLWGPAVDQLLADEQIGGPNAGVHWALTDNLNTLRDLATYNPTTQTTTVVNHREFSAYGELLSQTNPSTTPASVAAVDCLFAYTGRALSRFSTNAATGGVTGIQNNLNRWYDAITGRWFSQDPIGFKGGINLYEYVGDSPLTRTDPLGLLVPIFAPVAPVIANPPAAAVTGTVVVGLGIGYGIGYLPGKYITGPLTGWIADKCYGNPPLENYPSDARKPWQPGKPGRKKQGREPGEKKRCKPDWTPRNPPKDPPPHTPSRKT